MGEEERFDARAQEPKIGEVLRGAREERGLSLEEVEQATKIRTLYLKGLERDDHSVLPAPVYAQGFLKTYADYLGLDGAGLVRELKGRQAPGPQAPAPKRRPERTGGFERPLISPGDLAAAGRNRIPVRAVSTLLLAAVAFAAVVGALYFVGRGSQPSGDVAGSSPPPGANAERASREEKDPAPAETTAAAGSTTEETTGGTTEATAEATDPGTLRVTVRVANGLSWLQVETDGTTAFARVARPGFSKVFEAKREIGITTGNAGAVRAEVNGQNVGVLGHNGEVLTRRFTVKPESNGG